MSNPNDDHTLNACLARVIGREVFLKNGKVWHDILGDPEEWDPLHNPWDMEEVEAGLIEKGDIEIFYSYRSFWKTWNAEINIHKHWPHIFKAEDPDKKRAFALAIYQMEQSQSKDPHAR